MFRLSKRGNYYRIIYVSFGNFDCRHLWWSEFCVTCAMFGKCLWNWRKTSFSFRRAAPVVVSSRTLASCQPPYLDFCPKWSRTHGSTIRRMYSHATRRWPTISCPNYCSRLFGTNVIWVLTKELRVHFSLQNVFHIKKIRSARWQHKQNNFGRKKTQNNQIKWMCKCFHYIPLSRTIPSSAMCQRFFIDSTNSVNALQYTRIIEDICYLELPFLRCRFLFLLLFT